MVRKNSYILLSYKVIINYGTVLFKIKIGTWLRKRLWTLLWCHCTLQIQCYLRQTVHLYG